MEPLDQDAQSSETLSFLGLGSSLSRRRLSNVVGGGCLSWWWQAEKGWKGLAAGSRGIDPGLTRLNSLPQWKQGADGQWSSYPCVSTLSPILTVSPPFFLSFSCHVTNKTTILNRIRPKAYCLEWRAKDEKDGRTVRNGDWELCDDFEGLAFH